MYRKSGATMRYKVPEIRYLANEHQCLLGSQPISIQIKLQNEAPGLRRTRQRTFWGFQASNAGVGPFPRLVKPCRGIKAPTEVGSRRAVLKIGNKSGEA